VPLESLEHNSSLDGVVAPPPRPPVTSAIQSKRARELLERRKNWEFMRPEDLMAVPTLEEILHAPQYDAEGRQKEEMPAMERYYQGLTAKRPSSKSRNPSNDEDDLFGSSRKANPRDQLGSHDDSNLPSGLRERAEALKQMSESETLSDPFTRAATHGGYSDIFGLGDSPPSKERVAEHQKFMNDYHTMLDPTWRPPAEATALNPAFGLTEAAQPMRNAPSGLPGSSSPGPQNAFVAEWNVRNPQLGPAGLPDVNAQALGQPKPPPSLPTVQQPTVVAPSFIAPKRAF
jgi:hypothetical protein